MTNLTYNDVIKILDILLDSGSEDISFSIEEDDDEEEDDE